MDFSIVIPLYNEEDNVGELYNGIVGALDEFGRSYEVVFVDDGSSDKTVEKIKAIVSEEISVRLLPWQRASTMPVARLSFQWMETFKTIPLIFLQC
jgi:glycosyltransferase involved in cell wall biosynthesis